MVDDLPSDEARAIIALIKFGEPGEWDWSPELWGTANCAFGVTDHDGKRIQGVTADLLVKYGQRPPSSHFLFTIYKQEFKARRRVYQLDLLQNGRKKVDPHRVSHEHIGRDRIAGEAAWQKYGYEDALKLFCTRTNLTLSGELPDPYVLQLL
ncbi:MULTISPECIES: hypothetical protein [Burkholderia]|uniref:hypothetical protein n=1 Tax=Burkholderia TaxID=32008 RepID=UPI000F5AE7F6|nr:MULTISPECIES: hypothetical protein [Burkholderia]MBN3738969.1 hypothetical protein [Burkholderia sp. Tr-20355]RQS80333.1 hypothetical protein DF032_12860 [Burkholderia seminalis]RQS92907.1 hypothetical protein DF048_17625 [Burkholderia seminalis]